MILAHTFPVALCEKTLTINQDMKALVFYKTVMPNFAYWELYGFGRAFVALAEESAHGTRKMETEILAKFQLLVPPLSEQQAIVAYLDRETGKIDALITKVEEAIEKLKEYRTALISAVVTGKIDVREEVA
jgi:type I restriction enzyme S subunit